MHAIRHGSKDAVEAILRADFDVDQAAKLVDKVVDQTDEVRQAVLISCIRILHSKKDSLRLQLFCGCLF